MTPFAHPLRPEDVGALIDLSIAGDPNTASMAQMQREGIAALYNTLCEGPLAYLADEVGMGKTYQALGLAAVLWNEKPDARVLFIAPRENLQVKWYDDYRRFFASNYRRAQGLGDDRAASVLFGEPVHRPVRCGNLRAWAPLVGSPEPVAAFLRHTSFARPIYVTSRDAKDLDALWAETQRRLHDSSLFGVRRPKELTPADASETLNLAFARAVNAKLAEASPRHPYFDLVIVDEAQCLRNPSNQTNRVLFESLRGQAAKWLFMSATPAHGGPGDIATVVNHYPDAGEQLDPDLCGDLPAMQRELQRFMLRRPRTYKTKTSAGVGKGEYRKHEREAWAVRDNDMSTLETLAMGLVQKGLVDVLAGRSNRYRVGFLSSFESLQSSLNHKALGTSPDEAADEDAAGEWHRSKADASTESEAPDAGFIHDIASDFEARFGAPLPHPKVDSVVSKVAPLAYGSDDVAGGRKFLIFARRVSTVETLRRRLTARYVQSIEARVRRCWSRQLDWTGADTQLEPPEDDDDPEAFDDEATGDPFREAMSRKGWLFRYRQTFRASGRNACFFEDGWLMRLCQAGGVDPRQAARELPREIWAESWTHASRSAGKKRQQYRADRLRYLALQSIQRCPQIFGMDASMAAPWRAAYESALHHHLERATPAQDPHRDDAMFVEDTLWTRWDGAFAGTAMSLPAAASATTEVTAEALFQRQVARTLLGQTFRLTDTLLDLYFAEASAPQTPRDFADAFLGWVRSNDPASRTLVAECTDWLSHLRLIVDSSLDGAGRTWRELARRETWEQLYNLSAVLGVTGRGGGHRTATRQFRTPSLPRVIVCTDTLKEGVDLHLFCDRVLHYGVAWTSGDLEQRVGRVDRFFSQIERRLSRGAPPEVRLEVGYPHVVASLEKAQVERVIARQQAAEFLMDSPLAGTSPGEEQLVIGATGHAEGPRALAPFAPRAMPTSGRPLVAVSAAQAQQTAEHYHSWYAMLARALGNREWDITPGDPQPVRVVTVAGHGRQHELAWSFDAALGRYALTLSSPAAAEHDPQFSGGVRRQVGGRNRGLESFTRLLVPTPDEGIDDDAMLRLLEALEGTPPQVREDARDFWGDAVDRVSSKAVQWAGPHKTRFTVDRGSRAHAVTLYAYDGGVRVVGVVAALEDLGARAQWGEAPSLERVRDWALGATHDLPLGYLDVHPRDGLVFGVHVLHGRLSGAARGRLLQEVAWRADFWEASLTGEDRQ